MTNQSPGRAVLGYLTSNADRPITIDELHRELGPDLSRAQVSSAAGNLIATGKYENLERVQYGVYRWNSTVPTTEVKTEMMVAVVRVRDDGKMLVKDVDTDELYTMERFEF